VGKTHWILPSNPHYYDALGAFAGNEMVDWGTNNRLKTGDIVYIYIAEPIGRIIIKAEVMNEEVPQHDLLDDRFFMREQDKISAKDRTVRLKALTSYIGPRSKHLSYGVLQEHGLKSSLEGVLNLDNNPELLQYIQSIESS